jgi:hypothetical protein
MTGVSPAAGLMNFADPLKVSKGGKGASGYNFIDPLHFDLGTDKRDVAYDKKQGAMRDDVNRDAQGYKAGLMTEAESEAERKRRASLGTSLLSSSPTQTTLG